MSCTTCLGTISGFLRGALAALIISAWSAVPALAQAAAPQSAAHKSAATDGAATGRVFELGQPYEVTVSAGSMALRIQGANTGSVRMTEQNIPESAKVGYHVAGGVLHVTVMDPPSADGDTGRIVLTLPRYEFVHASSTSGDITVDNMSTEHLTIRTVSGRIAVTATNAALVASSDSGAQSYRNIRGAITATTKSAPITVDDEIGLVRLATESGAIHGTRILLQTTSTFRTSSGDIDVSLSNNLHQCTFRLNSVSGKLRVGQIDRTGTLEWGKGPIRITGRTESGSVDFR